MRRIIISKYALIFSLMILAMLFSLSYKSFSQEIVMHKADGPFIRIKMMDLPYFTRMLVMNGIYKLEETEIIPCDEGIVDIFSSDDKLEGYLAEIQSLIKQASFIDAHSDKYKQTEIINEIISAHGEWIIRYALSGKRNTENDSCHKSLPFCTGTTYYFPAGVNTGYAQMGPNYGCLMTTPNPVWYHLRIDDPGNITIKMEGVTTWGSDLDIDFAIWGPFSNPVNPCTFQLTANCSSCPNNTSNSTFYPSGNLHDCSYDPRSKEFAHITNGQTGEYYLLLITNYDNDPGNITFEKVAGSGTTDCGILPPPASNNSPVCVGETILLSAASAPNATYMWSGPNNFTSNLQNPQIPHAIFENAGVYSLIITIGNQTSDPTSTEVFVYNAPEATISGSISICKNDSALITISASGTGPYKATFSDDTGSSPMVIEFTQTPNSFWVHPTTTTLYTLTGISNIACAGTISGSPNLQVTVFPLPPINLYGPGIEHEGNTLLKCVFDTLCLVQNLPNTDLLWSNGSVNDTVFLWTSGISFDYRQMWIRATNRTTGCCLTEEFNVLFTFKSCSYGLDENEAENAIQLFPNPAKEWVNIRQHHPKPGGGEIQIYDVFGRMLGEFILPNTGEQDYILNVSHLPTGIYLVKIRIGKTVEVKKLVIGG